MRFSVPDFLKKFHFLVFIYCSLSARKRRDSPGRNDFKNGLFISPPIAGIFLDVTRIDSPLPDLPKKGEDPISELPSWRASPSPGIKIGEPQKRTLRGWRLDEIISWAVPFPDGSVLFSGEHGFDFARKPSLRDDLALDYGLVVYLVRKFPPPGNQKRTRRDRWILNPYESRRHSKA